MSEPEQQPEGYRMTEKGWEIAGDIWSRFVYEGEDINAIAGSYGMTVDEVSVLMAMAFQGGMISLD